MILKRSFFKNNIIIIYLFFSFFSFQTYAQQDEKPEIIKSSTTEIINGKKYYMHKVEKKQTLYSIAKAYNVLTNDIVSENPEITEGLKIGQILKIPTETEKKETVKVNKNPEPPDMVLHNVEQGQTFYSISKQYGVSIEAIKAANPELTEGLKAGQQIKIPISTRDQTKTSAQKDSSYITSSPEKIYKVALLLPFYLNMNDAKNAGDSDNKEIYLKSATAIEFYGGFMIAADSLKNTGLMMQAFVYDTPNDSVGMAKFLAKSELKEMNLIVGPFHSSPVVPAAQFAKKNEIPMVAPFSQDSKVLIGNDFISKATSSTSTQIQQTAQYIAKNYSKENIFILYPSSIKEKEKALVKIFCRKANALLEKDTVKEFIYGKAGMKDLTVQLSKNRNNIIFVPSTDQSFVIDLINKLHPLTKDYSITLFGMKNWQDFENLDIEIVQDLQLHLITNNYIDYQDKGTKKFIKTYREKYKTEPSTYAYQGFDVGMFYLKALLKYGVDFEEKLPEIKNNGIQTKFQFYKTAVESGYENQAFYILKYKDYSLLPVN